MCVSKYLICLMYLMTVAVNVAMIDRVSAVTVVTDESDESEVAKKSRLPQTDGPNQSLMSPTGGHNQISLIFQTF